MAAAAEPHKLASFLFELASAFTTFYEQCPVLTADGETRQSRLALSALTLRVLVTGLGLLGISCARADVAGQPPTPILIISAGSSQEAPA